MKTFTLLTGGSQGFGKALAINLAQRSMNLILVALPNSGLKELTEFLTANYDIEVCYFEMDLSRSENCMSLYEKIKYKGYSIKYIINNAGMLSKDLLEHLDYNYFLNQINVNVSTPTLLIKLFLNDLKRNAPSGVLNVGSMASFFHLPKKQVYAGTKAYMLSFSKSLNKELAQYGITISVVCPGGMNTTTQLCLQNRKLAMIPQKSILNPEQAAEYTVHRFLMGKQFIIPGALNRMCMLLNSMLPNFIKERLTKNISSQLKPRMAL